MLDPAVFPPFRGAFGAPPVAPDEVAWIDPPDGLAARPWEEVSSREAHHRIKNGLQLVASLLSLQAREADASAEAPLKEAARRVSAVASLHEHLQVSDDERVDVSDLLVDICADLADSAGCEARGISFDLILDDAELPGERAGPLALILSELATNCLKHAYPQTGGKITVRFERRQPGFRLSVADDGPGLDFADGARTMGLSLVGRLAQTLRGKLVVEHPAHGACIAVEFP